MSFHEVFEGNLPSKSQNLVLAAFIDYEYIHQKDCKETQEYNKRFMAAKRTTNGAYTC